MARQWRYVGARQRPGKATVPRRALSVARGASAH